jgi:hypothetical protein
MSMTWSLPRRRQIIEWGPDADRIVPGKERGSLEKRTFGKLYYGWGRIEADA